MFVGILFFQPEWFFTRLSQRSPEVLYSVNTDQRVVALTIDDGPDQDSTPQILDILDQWDAHATFFLITGNIPGNDEIVQRITAEGHELGNHLTRDEPSIQLSLPEFSMKLDHSSRILNRFGEVRWFRPGSGWYNDAMIRIIQGKNYRCVLGSIYPYDPQLSSPWFTSRYILWKLKPGSIIILHDHGLRGKRTTVVLKEILPVLNRRGYQLVTLSELIKVESAPD
jgi:peptidoglycan/xylan/chitin deacetylase (PgdA/CDA1 family)